MAAKVDRNRTKFTLDEKDIPTKWYNIQADLKTPAPPVLHPGTKQPIGPPDLAPLFPMELIKQEVSQHRWIEIPDEIRDVYRLWRPSPLFRARRLEKALGTPARIYYKYEGVSPAGSHKPNTAVAQAYYNKREKVTRLATETGAGQWGSALALACQMFGLQCKVYMVKVSYQQKPYRRIMMETWGAQVVASPSPDTQAGKKVLEQDPNSPGSLGIAISEAVEVAATNADLKELIDNGKFREDLYFRLAVVTIRLLPLRERGEDIVFLAREFLQRYANQNGRTKMVFAPDALRAMGCYSWPGNVRELQNRVKRGVIMADASRVSAKDLELAQGKDPDLAGSSATTLKQAREHVEREMVDQALKKNSGKITAAAADLGISRPTLYELMEKLGISKERSNRNNN